MGGAFRNRSSNATPSATPVVSSGTGAPGTTPTKIGDMYVDTAVPKVYISTGTSSSSDWTAVN